MLARYVTLVPLDVKQDRVQRVGNIDGERKDHPQSLQLYILALKNTVFFSRTDHKTSINDDGYVNVNSITSCVSLVSFYDTWSIHCWGLYCILPPP